MTPSPIPLIADVERITALADPVIRNLQITQCYAELSQAMTQRSGLAANWCTFATWASKQAGQTIRKQDMQQALQQTVNTSPDTQQAGEKLDAAAWHVNAHPASAAAAPARQAVLWGAGGPLVAMERASDAVARGNRKVFAEIGFEFARFFQLCLHDETFDAAKIERFCAALRPGDPPEGQRYLRQAFTRYYRSFFEADAKRRAELVFTANLEIGFHEQTRLQPEIAEALEAAFADDPQVVADQLVKALLSYRGWVLRLFLLVARLLRLRTVFDLAAEEFLRAARQQARLLLTKTMMMLSLPRGELLRLGQDLSGEYPASLRQIDDPELRALLAAVDPTPNSLGETGALDWANLAERLHFIADLFRSHQEVAALFDPPFSAEQIALLKAGQIPGGEL